MLVKLYNLVAMGEVKRTDSARARDRGAGTITPPAMNTGRTRADDKPTNGKTKAQQGTKVINKDSIKIWNVISSTIII